MKKVAIKGLQIDAYSIRVDRVDVFLDLSSPQGNSVEYQIPAHQVVVLAAELTQAAEAVCAKCDEPFALDVATKLAPLVQILDVGDRPGHDEVCLSLQTEAGAVFHYRIAASELLQFAQFLQTRLTCDDGSDSGKPH